jgi:hypothetical protein
MKSKCTWIEQRILAIGMPVLTITLALAWLSASGCTAVAQDKETGYTDQYPYRHAEFVDEGETPYYILMPGFQLVLEGPEDGEHITLVISVTEQTKKILVPEIGWVSTRVIEEKEWADGIPKETSRTLFAIDKKTNNVYDFGDETDIYNDEGTEVVSHEGGWLAGQPDANGLAKAGIFMPGTFLLGAKYYQQLAEGNSMERAENVEMGLTIKTPAGTFENCIKVRETNWSEPQGAETFKSHAPGIGLLGEDTLQLVAFGYDVFDRDKGVLKKPAKVEIAPIQAQAGPAQAAAPARKVTDDKAKEIALQKVPGQVTHVGLERKLGKLSIVVEVLATDGTETDVIIDMETGEVRGVEK